MERHSKRPCRQENLENIVQDSPFLLDIPGEIRTMIYRAALVKSDPIDLWPDSYIENAESELSLADRIVKIKSTFGKGCSLPRFRRQVDLEYVRKEMATGLLTTCRQISREAANIFWCENTFRFSGDFHWLGIRRFFESIGPRALSLIQKVEIFAPVCFNVNWVVWLYHGNRRTHTSAYFRETTKNVPKLRMEKVYSRSEITLYENMARVGYLLGKQNHPLSSVSSSRKTLH